MCGVSIVCAALAWMAVTAAPSNARRAGPSIASTRPGFVQNWPAPSVSDATNCVAIASWRVASAAGQQHRVDRAHFRIDGNRLVAHGRDVHQRDAAAARAGEADRLDARVGDERLTDLARRVEQQREHAGRQRAVAHGLLDRAADELGRARMRRVRLDDHRAAGGQRRRGVAARHREREREVRRAEHGHRADRDVAQPQVHARQRLALGARGVDARIDVSAVTQQRREQRELADRAAALAFDARARSPVSTTQRSISSSPSATMLRPIASRNAARCSGCVSR
jgi:hypothetical protein